MLKPLADTGALVHQLLSLPLSINCKCVRYMKYVFLFAIERYTATHCSLISVGVSCVSVAVRVVVSSVYILATVGAIETDKLQDTPI